MSREGRRGRWGVLQTFVIGKQGNPMMKRIRLIQTPFGGAYLHFIYREDLDPVPHDHPWEFWRIVLRGGYTEVYLTDPRRGKTRLTSPGRLKWSHFPTAHAHRIVSVAPGTVSLVLVGPKVRTWGFWTPEHQSGRVRPDRTWVDYRDALGLRPSEGVSS